MLIALFADIHANRQAFSACLAHARARDAQQIVLLGDYVGYGADPEWAVETVMALAAAGAVAVRGNHDHAISDPTERMNPDAQAAIDWTRGELSAASCRFLMDLPLTDEQNGTLYVHADASDPADWRYVVNTTAALRSLNATTAHVTFCGHTHQPALYTVSSAGKIASFTPTADIAIQLLPGRKWLAVLGSVGQPRDGNPAAAYALFETNSQTLTYCRVAYDAAGAAAKIRSKGLPGWLGDRLLLGR
jgi:diadenosine tetraphosphatase ApaH/serine/threonine PP2A family protein phosphatase